MDKEKVVKPDGRYIIYYTFDEDAAQEETGAGESDTSEAEAEEGRE